MKQAYVLLVIIVAFLAASLAIVLVIALWPWLGLIGAIVACLMVVFAVSGTIYVIRRLQIDLAHRKAIAGLVHLGEHGAYMLHADRHEPLHPASVYAARYSIVEASTSPAIETKTRLELPAPAVPTFAQLLTTRQLTPYEDASILGYTDGKPRTGQWAQLHSFMALGISGSGKSSTVAYYVALAVLHGARLLLIDPDAEEDDSLVQRLQALSFAFLCPPGIDAKSASRVLDIAEQELDGPGAYPVVWCVDEFSTIMRMGEKNLGAWGEIADRLAVNVEDWAQRGRKRKRTVIAIGQIGKASRTGGTELRASMTATFVHRLSTQQARLVLDGPDAKLCPTLDTGEVVVLLANSVETYRMHIPYTTPEDMVSVARLMARGEPRGSVRRFNGGTSPETSAALHLVDSPRTDLEPLLEPAWQAKIDRVRELREAKRNQGQIIYQVWGVSKGGSAEYARAREEYLQIVAQLNAEQAEQEVIP